MKTFSMKKLVIVGGLVSVLSSPVQAQIAVIDPAAIVHLTNQITEMAKQLETQKAMLENLTDGLGGWEYNSFGEYSENLPKEWGDVYSDALGGDSIYSSEAQSLLDALKNEVEGMNELEAVEHIGRRIEEKNATDRVMMQRVYDNQQLELSQMEELARDIEGATTQREVQELQARIQTSQGAIQANHVKLQNMAMLQEVQSRLLEDQRDQAARNRLVGDGSDDSFRAPRIN